MNSEARKLPHKAGRFDTKQFIIRVELSLGRIDLDPASSSDINRLVQSRETFDRYNGIYKEWPPNSSIFLDPPVDPLKGTPKDCLYWARLMKHRTTGCLKHAIFVKRGGLVSPEIERPSQFLSCYPWIAPPKRYLIPTYREELQVIYVPGLINNRAGFIKAFQDFGDIVEPIKEVI